MSEFSTWTDYWDFREAAKKERRFFWRSQTKVFLDAIRRTSKKRDSVIPKGTHFWRAQTGHEVEDTIPCPYREARMLPLRNRAREGRVNPQGIPVLYLATTRETAMSETRPWVGSFISLGEFVTKRDLGVIDCSRYHAVKDIYFPHEEPPRKDIERIVWTHIDQAFAEPVSRADDAADYVPTQILAEMFRDMGTEGIVYKSIFGHKSRNIALFDIEAVRLVNCTLHEVVETKFKFAERDQDYWWRPPLDQARKVGDIRFRR